MIARTRLGRFFKGFTLYLVAAALVGYFAFQAYHGNYGLLAQRGYEQEIANLTLERDALKLERAELEHRVGLLRADRLDPDLLEELARRELGFTHPNDLVMLRPGR